MSDLPPCDDRVFNYGRVLGVFDMLKDQAEAYCKSETARTGDLHDWHYVGGRVNILYLPAHIRTLLEELERLRDQLHLAEVVRAAQVEGLTQGAAGWRERANQLEAEVAGLREDAERYRWLREKQAYIGIHPHYKDLPIEQRSGWTIRLVPDVKNSFDAAIDAARKGTTPTTPPSSPSPRS